MLRLAVLLVAAVTSVAASTGAGVPPWELASWLARHGGLPYAAALVWLVLAPLPLAVAAWLAPRTPWPWVGVVTVHLLVPTLLAARFPHLLPGWAWVALAGGTLLGLGSVVRAFPAPGARPGS